MKSRLALFVNLSLFAIGVYLGATSAAEASEESQPPFWVAIILFGATVLILMAYFRIFAFRNPGLVVRQPSVCELSFRWRKQPMQCLFQAWLYGGGLVLGLFCRVMGGRAIERHLVAIYVSLWLGLSLAFVLIGRLNHGLFEGGDPTRYLITRLLSKVRITRGRPMER